MNLTFVYLAYNEDSELVVEAQRAAINAMVGSNAFKKVSHVLLDDAWCPVEKKCRDRFLLHNNSYRIATGYRRGTMILGGENLVGQIEGFCQAAEATEADVIVKVDADTLIFKVDWIETFAQDDEAECAGAFDFGFGNHTSVFGLCYALKSRILRHLLADVRKYPAHHKAWEDHEVSSRIFRIKNGNMDSLMRWRSNTHGDDFWVVPLRDANDTFIRARAINFAWDYSSTPDAEKKEYRAKVADFMKHLNDLNEKNKTY